jgi:hypothetical protein
MTDLAERFGPFKVRESSPGDLLSRGAVIEIALTETEVTILSAEEDSKTWPRDQFEVDIYSAYYGCFRLGRQSVWVNTDEGRQLDLIRAVLRGERPLQPGVLRSPQDRGNRWKIAQERGDETIVVNYTGRTLEEAATKLKAESALAAKFGYHPTSQTWAQGQWSGKAFLIAFLLFFVLIGFLVFLYMLIVKPPGTLTVTFTRSQVTAPEDVEHATGDTKVCPDCAETVKRAARVCRFCRYEFGPAEI